MNDKNLKRNWLLLSGGSLAVIGFGLSLMGEALLIKQAEESWTEWFGIGTLSLIVVNAGIALFGKAVTLRVKLDRLQEE